MTRLESLLLWDSQPRLRLRSQTLSGAWAPSAREPCEEAGGSVCLVGDLFFFHVFLGRPHEKGRNRHLR